MVRVSYSQEWIPVHLEPAVFVDPAQRQPDSHRPWSRRQVWVVGSWPTRRDQPVSVALSPDANRLALAVGQRLSVSVITDRTRVEPRLQMACALAPGLAWSPDGNKLAFRDDDGQGRLIDLSSRSLLLEQRLG